jgi:hypothetical protein
VTLDFGTQVLAITPGLVTAINPQTGKFRWTLDAGREASLSGEMPQIQSVSGHAAVAFRRNLGVELQLVRPLGAPAWGSRPAFLPAGRFDIRNVDADGANLYVPYDDRLAALRIDDGVEVWNVTLPASYGSAHWIARAAAGGVIVYPSHAIPDEPVESVVRRVGRSFLAWPTARRVAGLSQTLYEGWAARTVPVLVFDQDTGKELRRFELPALGPLALVSFTPGLGMTVMTGTRVYTLE